MCQAMESLLGELLRTRGDRQTDHGTLSNRDISSLFSSDSWAVLGQALDQATGSSRFPGRPSCVYSCPNQVGVVVGH